MILGSCGMIHKFDWLTTSFGFSECPFAVGWQRNKSERLFTMLQVRILRDKPMTEATKKMNGQRNNELCEIFHR